MGLLDGKVVLVTGAGNGIGRSHAMSLAAEGARIVVNDLGGAMDGTGESATAAQVVVDEIKAAGGDAVANTDSVTDPEGCRRMVQAAIDGWGRLDAVVNNAGIIRDVTFKKMEDAQWDAVLQVHLQGTYNVTRAALPAFLREDAKDRHKAIINTTSYSGLIGNFGQSNYAAAKAGIYGFTRVLSMELRKAGVMANCLAPIAKTRMTEDIAMVEDDWGPEHISPTVVFLCSDLAKNVTGRVFGVQGQRIHGYEMKMSDGVEKEGTERWTATEIAEKLDEIFEFEAPTPVAAASGGDIVTQVFGFFPEGFKAGKLPDWKANIQWKVKGGTDQTIVIADDACAVKSGLDGSPTCTIKTDKDTLVAMFKGELDSTKAFMTGKATADNMGDLMKLGQAFDFKKIGAAFMAAGGGAEPAATEDIVTQVFGFFPEGFKAGKLPDWKANIQWKVKGGTDQTIVIADDACAVKSGLDGSPTCTIKTDKDTLVAMFKGELDSTKAFMTGKATADNMGDLMKLGQVFDFKRIGAAFTAATPAAATTAEAAPEPTADTGPKTWPIGKVYDGGYAFVEPEHVAAYAAATNDTSASYSGDDAIAPPMLHVRLFKKLMFEVATDPELGLDLLRLVHGEHDATFHQALRPKDLVQVRAKLESVEEKSSGLLVTSRLFAFVDGDLAVEAVTKYFIRAKTKPEGGAKKPSPMEEPPPTSFEKAMAVGDDQSLRYAAASLDDNPIHTDADTAAAAGLPGIILQGLCTMAMSGASVTAQVAGNDPRKLRRLGVRFSKPVLNGTELSLKAWGEGDHVDFIVEGPDGKPVITNGVAEFA